MSSLDIILRPQGKRPTKIPYRALRANATCECFLLRYD
jgi:hypothetical protein